MSTTPAAAAHALQPLLKRVQFWGAHLDDKRVVEILRGEKMATACKADGYHLPDGEFDTGNWGVGDLVEVYDLRGRLRCLIRVTKVYNMRFGAVPERLWRAEVCRDAEHFRDAHRLYWPHEDLTPDFEMTAIHFRLAAPVAVGEDVGSSDRRVTHYPTPFDDLIIVWRTTPEGPRCSASSSRDPAIRAQSSTGSTAGTTTDWPFRPTGRLSPPAITTASSGSGASRMVSS